MKGVKSYITEKLHLNKNSSFVKNELDEWLEYIKDNGGDYDNVWDIPEVFTIFLQKSNEKKSNWRNGKKYSYPYFDIKVDKKQLENNECDHFEPYDKEYNTGSTFFGSVKFIDYDGKPWHAEFNLYFFDQPDKHSYTCEFTKNNADKILEYLNHYYEQQEKNKA